MIIARGTKLSLFDEPEAGIDLWSFSRLVDTFRALHPDETDAYSWWSYRFHARENNAGWRIDYFLCSDRAAEKIETASILSDIYGSDHCPVELEIAW